MSALMKMADVPLTMTSREIAELTDKEISHVHRDIRAMLEELKGHDPEVDDVREDKDQRGYTVCFHLTKGLSMTLVAGYNVKLRKAIIDRWQQLEAGAAPVLNMRDPRQMALAALQLIEVNQELQATIEQQQRKISEDAPKVDGFERIAKSDGSMCITDAAKTLQVQPRKLAALLQEEHWVYRRPMGSGFLAYQDRIQAGYLEHKVTTGEKGDGTEWTSTQVRVTPRGLTKLADVIRQAGLH